LALLNGEMKFPNRTFKTLTFASNVLRTRAYGTLCERFANAPLRETKIHILNQQSRLFFSKGDCGMFVGHFDNLFNK
jgi:hypothetical protein